MIVLCLALYALGYVITVHLAHVVRYDYFDPKAKYRVSLAWPVLAILLVFYGPSLEEKE